MTDEKNQEKKGSMKYCCIGIIIITIILVGASMLFQDTPDHTTVIKIGGKSFTMHNLTQKEIDNIEGNNTNAVKINSDDGHLIYMVEKLPSENLTVLSELSPQDNVTDVQSDGITYHNIEFADGLSSTVFKTDDGSYYQISYYNGNDFLFDYQSFGEEMNK